MSVIWCNSCLKPFEAGQVLNWNNNCQEVRLLITSNGFAPNLSAALRSNLSSKAIEMASLRARSAYRWRCYEANGETQRESQGGVCTRTWSDTTLPGSLASSHGKRRGSSLQLPLSQPIHRNTGQIRSEPHLVFLVGVKDEVKLHVSL